MTNSPVNTKSLLREPPKPKGWPLVGLLPQLRKGPLDFFYQMARDYGDVVRLDMGPVVFYLVSHPDQVKYILQDNHRNYHKGYEITKPLLGNGLVTSEGEQWLRQRRLLQPAFNRPQLLPLLPTMVQATEEMMAGWQARSTPETPLDIGNEMMMLTQTIILRTMFSMDLGDQSREAATAFTAAFEYFNTAMTSPLTLLNRLPDSPYQRYHRGLKSLNRIIYGIISERRRDPADRHDLLSMLLTAQEEGTGMTDEQVRDEIMTIFLAGHETTASLLGWTFYLLGLNPEIEARVRNEITAVCGDHTPNADEISQLTFTRMVLDETLRLFPPVWMFARKPIETDEVGGFQIPAGSMVILSPYVTHRLPAYWDDPEQFRPDRFSNEQPAGRPRFAYFPFGGGPRQCIGMPFALLEAPLLLTMILQHFRLELVKDRPVIPQPVSTLRPRGIFVKVHCYE